MPGLLAVPRGPARHQHSQLPWHPQEPIEQLMVSLFLLAGEVISAHFVPGSTGLILNKVF